MIVTFTVPGKISTDHRPRATAIGGKARMFKSVKYRTYLKQVAAYALEAFTRDRHDGGPIRWMGRMPQWPLDARYSVTITLHEPDRRSRDLDNAKAIMDGLSGIAWHDDRQVDAYTVTRGEVRRLAPCVVVSVETIAAKGAER